MDEEHHKHVCGVLREVNEDEHDLRSGRRLKEFEFPGNNNTALHRDLVRSKDPLCIRDTDRTTFFRLSINDY